MISCLVGGRRVSNLLVRPGKQETKKRKTLMQKIKNKPGLALGAAISLIASLFVTTPAALANENAAVITPKGDGALSLNSMLITETFEMRLRYGTGVAGAGNNTVTDFSIHYVVSSTSPIVIERDADGTFPTGATHVTATSISGTTEVDGFVSISSASPWLSFGLAQTNITSVSPAVSITVTPYIELDGTTGMSSGDSQGTPYTINFVAWSAIGASVTLQTPMADARGITASVTVTAGTIRWSQLNGEITTNFTMTGEEGSTNSASVSGVANTDSTDTAKTGAELTTANFSFSAAVKSSAFTTSDSVSAQVFYVPGGSVGNQTSMTAGNALTALSATTKVAVAARTFEGVTMSVAVGDNVKLTSDGAATARVNSAFTVNAFGYSASATTSIAGVKAVTVSAVGTNVEFGATSGVILNGTTYTSSAGLLAAGFDLASATHTFTMSTFGQDYDASNDTITLVVSAQGLSKTLVVTIDRASYTPVYEPTTVFGLAGASKTFALTVEDQWGVAPVRTDLRIKAVMVLSSSESEAVSANVSGGAASVTLAPLPATRTGSGTVTFTLQTFNQDTQKWDDGNTDSATWRVYSYAAGTDAFTSRTATASASISYGVSAYSWSGVVSVKIVNSYSNILVSAPGLVIENNDDTTMTGSGTLTVAPDGQTANLRFASKKSGTYTVTFTTGTVSTTSVITIHAAASDKGASITWDTTAIDAGKTRVITGTLVDANGNPVDTTRVGATAGDSGTASIVISYVGTAGIVAGTLPSETDADGKFRISVLTAAADNGSLTITATYMPQGASTVAASQVTSVQAVAISPAAAPEVNAVIGSFNGRWAVRVENAKGSVVSVKAGNRWVKFTSLNNNYLYSMKSVKGRTIAVSVWVDGELQNSQTITIK